MPHYELASEKVNNDIFNDLMETLIHGFQK